jgi:hypothetical protein
MKIPILYLCLIGLFTGVLSGFVWLAISPLLPGLAFGFVLGIVLWMSDQSIGIGKILMVTIVGAGCFIFAVQLTIIASSSIIGVLGGSYSLGGPAPTAAYQAFPLGAGISGFVTTYVLMTTVGLTRSLSARFRLLNGAAGGLLAALFIDLCVPISASPLSLDVASMLFFVGWQTGMLLLIGLTLPRTVLTVEN